MRERILFGIVTCSTHLRLSGITENAIEELKQLPDFAVSQAFMALAKARAADDFGQPQEALNLIECQPA